MNNDLNQPMQQSKLQNYNSQRGATAYKGDYQRKLHRKLSDRRERVLLQRYFRRLGHQQRILDLPCGHGRIADFLKAQCDQLIAGDWSFTMVALNRLDHDSDHRNYCRVSALQIPLADRSVDVVVSLRLSHHLESQSLRERHLQELFRVADKAVIVSWFSATSLKNRLRQLQVRFAGKPPKHVLHNHHVVNLARTAGFACAALDSLFLIGSGHSFGFFLRQPDTSNSRR